jgi:hypothetical protein
LAISAERAKAEQVLHQGDDEEKRGTRSRRREGSQGGASAVACLPAHAEAHAESVLQFQVAVYSRHDSTYLSLLTSGSFLVGAVSRPYGPSAYF